MNVISRGIKNATRSPLRSGAIILMFAMSVALILSMLVARSSVQTKIEEVKASAGTSITISPAGVMGFQGGGDPLTADQIETITSTDHIVSTVSTLSDQLGEDDTDLESALELGSFGQRQMRFDQDSDSTGSNTESDDTISMPQGGGEMGARITVTGTTDVNSVSTDGGDLDITSGEAFDADSTDYVAVIGTELADENELEVGDTFTAYDETITVLGIYETGNTFQDGNVILPIATLQELTDQDGAVTSVVATVDSSDNVNSVVESLTSSLGDAADIESDIERAESSVSSLESISSLTLAGVIAATIAGAVIVLLAMIVVIRERRREIGVMKAIGGTDTKVVGQFVTEGMSLTVIGAIIGLVLGVLISGPMTTSLVDNSSTSDTSQQMSGGGRPQTDSSDSSDSSQSTESMGSGGPSQMFTQGAQQLGTNITEVTASLTPQVFFSALAVTILVALVGSAIPAWLTARIRPAEVLRND